MITDSARLYAGHLEDSFVLLPLIVHDRPDEDESLVRQPIAGRSVADLHAALADYPWAANSYREQFVEALTGELLLPADVLDPFERHRAGIVDRLAPLPHQLVHGDLTPDNVLISRDDNTAAFIDFDHLPLAPRVWDLGKYLSRLLRSTSPEAALPGAAAFVAGYHEVTALSEEELDALPAAIITMNLLEVDWVTRILTGRLERRLLPSQEAELTGAVGALRWQFHRWGDLSTALRAGLR
jgi:Ser/Thr protein kinase RdoA (MazF antagonist)